MPVRPIVVNVEELALDREQTYITSSAASGTSTLTVKSISGFDKDQILLIGTLGDENSEIIKTHASTVPSGTTITLAANLVNTHPVYTRVTHLLYDQVEFSHATTETGSKSVLSTINIAADNVDTIQDDTTKTSGFYFTRFKDTIGSTFSDYTDPQPHAGLDQNTVGYAIDYALRENKTDFTDTVSFSFCLAHINGCLDAIRGELKRWSKLQEFDFVIGQTVRGVHTVVMPSDIYDNSSNRSIENLKIGREGAQVDVLNLKYRTKAEFDEIMAGVAWTQVRSTASENDTSLDVDNSYDFSDGVSGGTGANLYSSGNKIGITYTGETRSATAGVFTGIPSSGAGRITEAIEVDDNLWQGEKEGQPIDYTVWNNKIYFWPLPSGTYDNFNIYLDYWKEATNVDSDGDTFDLTTFHMVKYWLTWMVRNQLKNDGKKDMKDGDFQLFQSFLKSAIRAELGRHGQRKRLRSKVNRIVL